MRERECSFTSGDERLDGTIYIPKEEGTFPGVVIYHGLGSRKDRYVDRAQVLVENGIAALIFSFRGCGKSEGVFKDQTPKSGRQDALAGFDYLTNYDGIDKDRVGVYGGSYGGYLAALVTEKRPVQSLVLSAPVVYKDEWWDKLSENTASEASEFRRSGEFSYTKAMQAIAGFIGNLLVIKHEKDEAIAERVVDAYFDQAIKVKRKKMHVIKNAPHALHDQRLRDESNKVTAEWFTRTLKE